mmetsp:Transcript_7490/g.11282  ORF Transcript_7490/g.11282 Transcript_7490/m.11282 type:complete len:88 (-) Transcript_7490:53-316(-)
MAAIDSSKCGNRTAWISQYLPLGNDRFNVFAKTPQVPRPFTASFRRTSDLDEVTFGLGDIEYLTQQALRVDRYDVSSTSDEDAAAIL